MDFEYATSILFQALYKRGYPRRFLRSIKSEIKSTRKDTPLTKFVGSSPCNGNRCQRCPYILECQEITINRKVFRIKADLNCNSDNVIYVISCLLCNVFYIGQTSNPLRTRLGQHISDINLSKNTSVANHFNQHSVPLNTFRIAPIIRVKDTDRRKSLEMKFIRSFDTLNPTGLNDRFDPYNTEDQIIPIIIPFCIDSALFTQGIKKLAVENKIDCGRIITAFKRSKNLADHLNKKL